MKAIKPKDASYTFAGDGYADLFVRMEHIADPVIGSAPFMVSNWQPSAEELEKINLGYPIRIRILGSVHPPIIVDVEDQ